MQTLLRHVQRLGLLGLLCLATSLPSCSRADTGPPAPSLPSPIRRPTWAVLDTLTRLLPIDTYAGPLRGTLALAGGRDEVADAQLALFAAGQPWHGVSLRFSNLAGPGKALIPAAALQGRPVGMVQTQKPNYQTRYVGLWPDPLLPAAPVTVDAGGRAFVWITLHIPATAKAGTYTGTLTLSSAGQPAQTVPVAVRVWGYTMPRQSHIRTAFGTGFNGKYPMDDNAVKDDLLAHRLTPTDCVGMPQGAPGQPQTWNWTQFDRRFSQRLAQGMTGFAVDFPNQNPAIVGAFQKHLFATGRLKYAYVYAADEPQPGQLPALNQTLAAYKQATPQIPLLVTARGYPPALSNVDIWCPAIVVERDDYFQPTQSQQAQARGKASWWYVAYSSHAPSVNLWTDYPLLDDRIWPWLTWKENVDGMLYWSVTNWQDSPDPLHNARTFLDANGDGELFYPGADGRPLDSLRVECLRDGMQDYEVLCLLEAGARELNAARKSPALAQQAASLCAIDNSLIGDYKHFNTDPRALLATRARMSAVLEQVVAVLHHTPAIVGRPRYRSVVAAAP